MGAVLLVPSLLLSSICEVIIYGGSKYEIYNARWSVEDKRNVQAHLNVLEN